ncbi:MAG: prepilin-type N-terminal cleavage/methylation domain-containing protein [Candidatus Saccharimonadales bacterium]|nr:prepilin-type N-terminal cleavage/methylation domain-containing protein [Candidatus Saccharimonadales bacterium]
MLKRLSNTESGDTLVEVLVATVVLTIILAAAYTIANRSTRINQASIERTEVANQLAEQAELLRAIRTNYDPNDPDDHWKKVRADYSPDVSIGDHDCQAPGGSPFYLDPFSDPIGKPEPYSFVGGVSNDAYGDIFRVWIVSEGSPNDISNTKTIDDQRTYHIRGCWEGIGGLNIQRAEVLLRLRI